MTLTPRPTTYRGIPMRSRLEATFAQQLDDEELAWEYEPRAYAGRAGQYLPDFEVTSCLRDGCDKCCANTHPIFIEVRPTVEGANRAMDQMEVIWESEEKAELIVVIPNKAKWWRHPGDDHWHCDH